MAAARDAFEEHVATPPALDLPALSAAVGLPYTVASGPGDLEGTETCTSAPTARRMFPCTAKWERVAVTIRTM